MALDKKNVIKLLSVKFSDISLGAFYFSNIKAVKITFHQFEDFKNKIRRQGINHKKLSVLCAKFEGLTCQYLVCALNSTAVLSRLSKASIRHKS